MSKFDDFTRAVESGAKALAGQVLKGFLTEARDDSKDFLKREADNLQRWTGELARGELTKEDFESLVRGEGDLAELLAMTQAGIAAADLQRFRDGLINLVIDSAFKTFLA